MRLFGLAQQARNLAFGGAVSIAGAGDGRFKTLEPGRVCPVASERFKPGFERRDPVFQSGKVFACGRVCCRGCGLLSWRRRCGFALFKGGDIARKRGKVALQRVEA